MSYEASIIINCESYSSRIKDFILIMNDIKWGIYNDNEYVSYLPKGDDGLFDWKADKSSVEQILNIIDSKQDNNETVGINLYFNREDCGVSLLADKTSEIRLLIDIGRKDLPDRTTDFSWYFQKIIIPLRKNGCIINKFTFEEYMD